MRIGIVCYPTYGGSGAVATELGRMLARRGHQVHFISYSRPFRLGGEFHENIHYHEIGNETYPLFQGQLYTLSAAVKMVEVIRHEGLDIVHTHYALPHAISAWLAREMLPGSLRVPMVTTLHGTDITLVGSKPSFHPAVQLGLDKSDALTSVSRWLAVRTCEIFSVCDRNRVIYNFIDPEVFKPGGCRCNRGHFAREDEKLLMHISNFRPVKRIAEVIKIFAQVARAMPARLVLVGDGPDRDQAELLAGQLGVADRIHMIGKQPNVEFLLPMADLFVFPSAGESFGLAALEAMSCEVPVVGCRAGGLPEVVIDGECGLLRDLDDTEGLAEAAIRILKEPGLGRAMGQAGRRRAIEHFHADRIVPQYEALYEELTSGRPVQ